MVIILLMLMDQFQFYKNPEKWSAQEGWDDLEKLVTVEFKELNETETK